MDGFELLASQHRDVEQLLARYFESSDDAVAHDICDLLTLHSEVEEQALYPELRRIVDDGDDLADRAEAEHATVKSLIARIYEAPPIDLRPLVEELGRDVAAHVEYEEGRLFPEMREVGVDGNRLAERIHAATGEAASRSSGQVG